MTNSYFKPQYIPPAIGKSASIHAVGPWDYLTDSLKGQGDCAKPASPTLWPICAVSDPQKLDGYTPELDGYTPELDAYLPKNLRVAERTTCPRPPALWGIEFARLTSKFWLSMGKLEALNRLFPIQNPSTSSIAISRISF